MPRCRKVSYRNQNAAEYKLTRLWKQVRSSRRLFTERHAYECGKCGRWHLTSE